MKVRKKEEKKSPSELATAVLRKLNEGYKLSEVERPPYDPPELPNDISAISGDELGCLQGQFAGWANYVEGILAIEEVMKWEYESVEDVTIAKERLKADGNVQDRKDQARIARDTLRAESRAMERKARSKLLQVKLNQFERAQKTLSREQARREAELQRGLQ